MRRRRPTRWAARATTRCRRRARRSCCPADAKNSLNGTPCPANKLVITPPAPLPDGASVHRQGRLHRQAGRPQRRGRHHRGLVPRPRRRLRDHRARRLGGLDAAQRLPGGQADLRLRRHGHRGPHGDRQRRASVGAAPPGASAEFPGGSVTWRWHSAAPIASYLVEDSIGNYRLTERTVRRHQGLRGAGHLHQRGAAAEEPGDHAHAAGITRFESRFTGPYPFTSDGDRRRHARPPSFDEEMETMIAFSGGTIDTDTLYHENMHQWWGDNVTEGGYRMTFFKEGMATFAEFLYQARLAENAAGGPSTPRRPGRLPGQPGAPVQRDLRARRIVLDGGAVEPRPVGPLLGLGHLLPARCRLHRAAPDPRPRQLHPGAQADPAHLRRGQHQRTPARSRLPPLAARCRARLPGRGCAGSSPSGSTRPTRRAAERTGPRSPVRASPAPAPRRTGTASFARGSRIVGAPAGVAPTRDGSPSQGLGRG